MAVNAEQMRDGAAGALATSELADFWQLMKPNVMKLVVFTGFVGLFLAPGSIHPLLGLTAILCMAAGSGAAAAINNWFDADIDQRMVRTRGRPTAAGRIAPAEALGFGVTLSLISILLMGLAVGYVAAALLALTIGFYVFIYTMWLKRRTPQNIVIGGAAGAFPPMIGWAAVTGGVSIESAILFLIIFFWTPPHFWALAIYRTKDYARVGVPMLPCVAGERATIVQIALYTALLVILSLLPVAVGMASAIYALTAIGLGGVFSYYAWSLMRKSSPIMALRMFKFSIIYLFALFGALVLDHMLAEQQMMVLGWLL